MFTTLLELVREYPGVSFSSMMVMFAFLGYSIVTQYLMDKQIRSFLPKTIFIVTFVCSLSLLAMYLYEISSIHLSEALWDFLLSMEVFMCIIVIPTCLILRLPFATYQITIRKKTKIPIFGIVFILVYLRILAYWEAEIKSKKAIQEEGFGIFSKGHINVLVEILVNYGVVIMALMSAYGAVWCPYIYFNRTQSKRQQLEEAKKKTKQQIFFIIEQIKQKKYNVLKLKQEKQVIEKDLQAEKIMRQNESILMRGIKALTSSFSSKNEEKLNSLKEQIQFHNRELDTLQRVHHESFSIFRQIVDQQKKHLISETLMGKLFRLFSFVLAVYSVSRICLTAWNMIQGRKLSTDPITRFLNFITWMLDEQINDFWRTYSQYISFGFMGYLMISSVRSFSINIKNFFDLVLRRRRLNIMSTDTLVLLIAEMYGIYFLSAVILLQSGLPRTYVTNFENITGEVNLVEHFTFFDKIFFWCSISSIIFIFICQMQRKQKMNTIMDRNFVDLSK